MFKSITSCSSGEEQGFIGVRFDRKGEESNANDRGSCLGYNSVNGAKKTRKDKRKKSNFLYDLMSSFRLFVDTAEESSGKCTAGPWRI